MEDKELNIFLAETSKDMSFERDRLHHVLQRAGLKVLSLEDQGELWVKANSDMNNILQYCNCSVHIIGDEYDYLPELKMSFTEFQITQVFNFVQQRPDFKIFIWRPGYLDPLPKNEDQRNLWFALRNKINSNIIILNSDSPILVAEDIRTIMSIEHKQKVDTSEAEVFFIYNEADSHYATQIIDLLQDVASVVHTEVSLSADFDYENYIAEQMKHSILPVIYFRKASSWASFFIQQVWRLIGGASADKNILFIGDDAEPENLDITFDAPNVETIITGFDLIPLEIKVQLDKVKQQEKV